jgi:protein disulfide-isomerase
MKKLLFVLFLLVGSYNLQAQEISWHTNLDKAVAASNKAKKPIMMFFTGSDWCGWCIRLQKEVLKTPEFAAWAKENVILLELDFPRRSPMTPELSKQNMELQQMFQVQGYPTVWFAKATVKNGQTNFDKIGSTGYVAGGPQKWLEGANQILGK